MALATLSTQKVLIHNDRVHLRPLVWGDVDALLPIALEPGLWDLGLTAIRDRAELEAYVRDALHDQSTGEAYPFAVVDPVTQRVVGTTRLYEISLKHKHLSIGWTWLSASVRGSGLNLAKKFEMLRFAFETLGMNRVQFKVDALNARSRRAIQKLGATEEGVLRQHLITYNGRVRDSVICSIVRSDWPTLKETVFATVAPGTVIVKS